MDTASESRNWTLGRLPYLDIHSTCLSRVKWLAEIGIHPFSLYFPSSPFSALLTSSICQGPLSSRALWHLLITPLLIFSFCRIHQPSVSLVTHVRFWNQTDFYCDFSFHWFSSVGRSMSAPTICLTFLLRHTGAGWMNALWRNVLLVSLFSERSCICFLSRTRHLAALFIFFFDTL